MHATRRTLINLAFFSLVFFTLVVWAVRNIVTIDQIDRPYELTGDFAAASGVLPTAEVTYLGVQYGRVSDVERTPDGVRVTMLIDRDRQIPAGADAFIFRKSAVGEPYVDFRLPEGAAFDDDAPVYEAGDHVPLERTEIPLEFADLLRSASRLIGAINPEEAGLLIHELALALNGRAESLRTLTEAGAQLMSTFAANTEMLDRLATNSTRITHVVTEHRGSLGGSLTNLAELSDSLAAADGDTQILLDRGTQLLGTAADLVADQKGNLDCLLHDLAAVIPVLNSEEHIAGLRTLIERGPGAFALLFSTRDVEADGVWARVNLELGLGEGSAPPQYVPPRDLPAVPEVPPCSPTVAPPRTGDFNPTQVLGQSTGRAVTTTLAATGGAVAAGVTSLLITVALTGRWLARLRREDG
ncbi:MAG: MCE family protein [Acidimicrobiales bacterium]